MFCKQIGDTTVTAVYRSSEPSRVERTIGLYKDLMKSVTVHHQALKEICNCML